MRAEQSEDVDEPTTWPPVYTEPVWMMKKTDRGRCSAIMRSLTRPQQCQKAESVFLIFCKTFGSRRIGLHGSHVHCCGRRNQMGWGFPPFTQTLLNDRKWTIMRCDTINKTMVLALPWLSPEGLRSTNRSENCQLQSHKILNQLKHVSDLKWPMQSFSLFFLIEINVDRRGQKGSGRVETAEGTFLLVELVVEVLLALSSWWVPVERQPLAFPVFMIIEERSGE